MKPGPDADRALIAHMQQCLALIADYTGGDRIRFDASSMVRDAVIRNLQIFTESSQRLSESIKSTEPEVPWRELSGFRNVLVHGYLGVDLEAVWSVIEQDLPTLTIALQRMAQRGF